MCVCVCVCVCQLSESICVPYDLCPVMGLYACLYTVKTCTIMVYVIYPPSPLINDRRMTESQCHELENAVLERCSPHGAVVHVWVDKKSPVVSFSICQ